MFNRLNKYLNTNFSPEGAIRCDRKQLLQILDEIEIKFPMELWHLFMIRRNTILIQEDGYGKIEAYLRKPKIHKRRDDGFSPRVLKSLFNRFYNQYVTCLITGIENETIFTDGISWQLPHWMEVSHHIPI